MHYQANYQFGFPSSYLETVRQFVVLLYTLQDEVNQILYTVGFLVVVSRADCNGTYPTIHQVVCTANYYIKVPSTMHEIRNTSQRCDIFMMACMFVSHI